MDHSCIKKIVKSFLFLVGVEIFQTKVDHYQEHSNSTRNASYVEVSRMKWKTTSNRLKDPNFWIWFIFLLDWLTTEDMEASLFHP